MKKKVFVYLLRSDLDHSFYAGITYDLISRLKKHNRGEVSSTKRKRPFTLVYTKEHNSYKEARAHEKWLKKKNRDYKVRIAQLAPPEIGGVK